MEAKLGFSLLPSKFFNFLDERLIVNNHEPSIKGLSRILLNNYTLKEVIKLKSSIINLSKLRNIIKKVLNNKIKGSTSNIEGNKDINLFSGTNEKLNEQNDQINIKPSKT